MSETKEKDEDDISHVHLYSNIQNLRLPGSCVCIFLKIIAKESSIFCWELQTVENMVANTLPLSLCYNMASMEVYLSCKN